MCTVPKFLKPPKPPSIEAAAKIPERQPVLLPDGGDPSVVASLRSKRRLGASAMILSSPGGTLGSPSTTGPIGASGM